MSVLSPQKRHLLQSQMAALILAFLALVVAIVAVVGPFWWYKDGDADGFGDPDQRIWALWQPDGYAENNRDCYDGNKDVRPGQTSFFAEDRGDGSFDYDCNGESERELTQSGSCDNGTANQGWEGAVPAPGQTGSWLVDCDRIVHVLPPSIKIVRETVRKIQKGR